MQVLVNGEAVDVADDTTVSKLLDELGLGSKWVLVERNREPVPRDQMPRTLLQAGDRLELVRAVAGG